MSVLVEHCMHWRRQLEQVEWLYLQYTVVIPVVWATFQNCWDYNNVLKKIASLPLTNIAEATFHSVTVSTYSLKIKIKKSFSQAVQTVIKFYLGIRDLLLSAPLLSQSTFKIQPQPLLSLFLVKYVLDAFVLFVERIVLLISCHMFCSICTSDGSYKNDFSEWLLVQFRVQITMECYTELAHCVAMLHVVFLVVLP